MSTHHKTLLVVRHPGKTPDKALLEHVLKEYPTATGMAVAENGTLQADGYKEAATADAVLEVCGRYPNSPIVMSFCNFPEKFKDDDIPPFIVLGEKDNPSLVLFAEGDFANYKKDNSEHSEAFFAFFEYIRPLLKKMEMQFGGDVKKVLQELKDPLTQQNFKNLISGTGSLAFFSKFGEVCSIVKQPMQMGYEWGWISNPHGFKAAVAETPEKKSLFAFGKSKAKAEEPPPPAPEPSKEEPKKEEKQPVVEPPVKEEETRKLVEGDPMNPICLVQAPATCDSKNKKRDFYRAWLPFAMESVKDRPAIEINFKNIKGAEKLNLAQLPPGISVKPLAGKTATALPKTKDQEQPRQHVSPTENKVETVKKETDKTGDDLVLTADQKLAIDTWMRRHEVGKEFVDNNQTLIVDPAEIQKMEKQLPKFTEQMGITGGLKAFAGMDPLTILELCYESPEAARLLIMEQGLKILQLTAETQNKGTQEGHTVSRKFSPFKKSA